MEAVTRGEESGGCRLYLPLSLLSPVFAPALTCALPHHYPHRSPRHCEFLCSSPSSACLCHVSQRPPSPRRDPSLPSCQSLLSLAARWPGQSGAPGPRAPAVMTGKTGLHTLSTTMWRSACHICPQLYCTHTHTNTGAHAIQVLTFSLASLSDELLCRRNPPFLPQKCSKLAKKSTSNINQINPPSCFSFACFSSSSFHLLSSIRAKPSITVSVKRGSSGRACCLFRRTV